MYKHSQILLSILCLVLFNKVEAQDNTLKINLSKQSYLQGDSLEIQIVSPNYLDKKLKSATAHIWIEIGRAHV